MTVYYERLIISILFTYQGANFPSYHFLFKERNAPPLLTCLSLRAWVKYLYGLSLSPHTGRLLSHLLEIIHAIHVQPERKRFLEVFICIVYWQLHIEFRRPLVYMTARQHALKLYRYSCQWIRIHVYSYIWSHTYKIYICNVLCVICVYALCVLFM